VKRYRLELFLAVVMVASFAGVSHWQAPGRTLTKADVDDYLRRIDAGVRLPAGAKADVLAHLRSWGERDDGRPVFMLNLMRYRDEVRTFPGHPERTGSPRDLNAHYEDTTAPILFGLGAYPLFAGEPEGVRSPTSTNLLGYDEALENWSRVLVVRYPDRRAFFELLSNPEYQTVLPYKLAALEVVLVPMRDEILIPDLRWALATAMLAIFALVVMARSTRRRRSEAGMVGP
jgi:hypothetical protein